MGKTRDITDFRFGKLTALYPSDFRSTRGSVYWHCQCDCGREADVTEESLVRGSCKSCGCLKKKVEKNIHKQLHFVNGTCVEWIEKRNHRSDNTSGFRGVSRTESGSYRAVIGFKGKRYYLGAFREFGDAVQARLTAEDMIYKSFIKAYRDWQNMPDEENEKREFVFEVVREKDGFRIITNSGSEA